MPRFQALECISAVLSGGGVLKGRERARKLPPAAPPPPRLHPLPGASPPLSSLVLRVWSLGGGVWVTYGTGHGHGWMRWDGARAGRGKGHWRLSSVSDRENAVTTSSAPENTTAEGSLSSGSGFGVAAGAGAANKGSFLSRKHRLCEWGRAKWWYPVLQW